MKGYPEVEAEEEEAFLRELEALAFFAIGASQLSTLQPHLSEMCE